MSRTVPLWVLLVTVGVAIGFGVAYAYTAVTAEKVVGFGMLYLEDGEIVLADTFIDNDTLWMLFTGTERTKSEYYYTVTVATPPFGSSFRVRQRSFRIADATTGIWITLDLDIDLRLVERIVWKVSRSA